MRDRGNGRTSVRMGWRGDRAGRGLRETVHHGYRFTLAHLPRTACAHEMQVPTSLDRADIGI